jgi:hypothetical protein
MKRSSSAVVLIALVAFCLFSPPSSASPPLCAGPRSVRAEFDAATAVFRGRVIGKEEREFPHPIGPVKKSQVFRFIVEEWWKGENKREAEVHIPKFEISKGRYAFWSYSFKFKE